MDFGAQLDRWGEGGGVCKGQKLEIFGVLPVSVQYWNTYLSISVYLSIYIYLFSTRAGYLANAVPQTYRLNPMCTPNQREFHKWMPQERR